MTYDADAAASDAPEIVQQMSEASLSTKTGPMAAVAASIAWTGIDAVKQSGASFGLIDNGGGIVLFSDRKEGGLFTGNAPSSSKYAFIIPPQKEILSVCTSSVSPSISFGIADVVVCFSKNQAKADTWDTGLCNVISPDSFPTPDDTDICGVYAVAGDGIERGGKLLKLVEANVDTNLITKG